MHRIFIKRDVVVRTIVVRRSVMTDSYLYASSRPFNQCISHLKVLLRMNASDSNTISFAKQTLHHYLINENLTIDQRLAIHELVNRYHQLSSKLLSNNTQSIQDYLSFESKLHNKDEQSFNEWIHKVIETIKHSSLSPIELIHPAIIYYTNIKHFNRVEYLYNTLQSCMNSDTPMTLTSRDFGFLICAAIKNNRIEFAEKVFNDAQQKYNIHFTKDELQYILTSYTQVNRIQEAMDLFRKLVKEFNEDPIHLVVYTVLLDQLRKNLKSSDEDTIYTYTLEVIQQLSTETTTIFNHSASYRTYVSVLNALADIGDIKYTEYWFKRLLESGVKYDIRSLNAVVKSMITSNHPLEAESFIHTMKRKYGIGPDVVSFNMLINYYSEKQETSKSLELVHEMYNDFNITPDQISFNSIIQYCDNSEVGHVLKTMMNKYKISLNTIAYNILIKKLCDNGSIDEALVCFQRMKTEKGINSKPDSITIATLVLAHKHDEEMVDKLYMNCVALNLKPNHFLAILLIQYSKLYREYIINRLKKSTSIIKRTHRQYPELYSTLLHVMLNDLEDRETFQFILNSIQRCGITITPKNHQATENHLIF
jgi:pentatricopeptide repeat protein